jgi:hypothetical protein
MSVGVLCALVVVVVVVGVLVMTLRFVVSDL